MLLRDIAAATGCELEGPGEIEITRVVAIHDARPGDLTFVANRKYVKYLADTQASAVILGPGLRFDRAAVLRAANPYLAFARALRLLSVGWRPPVGLHPSAVVGEHVSFDDDVSIGPLVAIGDSVRIGTRTVIHANVTLGRGCVIGADCVIHSNVSIRENVIIGNRVVLQNGAVIGGDGYGFARSSDGHEKVPQTAAVVIEDDVEIGANSTVDRPPVGETRICSGAKLDNLVHIGHGVTVGRRALIAAQTGIAGSTILGDDVVFGGQVGVASHLTIASEVKAVGQTGITKSIRTPGSEVAGYPAISRAEWRRVSVLVRQLPEMRRRLNELEAKLGEAPSADEAVV